MATRIEPTGETQPPRGNVRVLYLGPVAPHWEIRSDFGERSVIDEFRTRFDFSHNQAVTADEIAEIERRVNAAVLANVPVTFFVMLAVYLSLRAHERETAAAFALTRHPRRISPS